MTRGRLGWQAQTAIGVAHGYTADRPGARALCSGSIRRVDERYARPVKSRCTGCLMEATRAGLLPEAQMPLGLRPPGTDNRRFGG